MDRKGRNKQGIHPWQANKENSSVIAELHNATTGGKFGQKQTIKQTNTLTQYHGHKL